MDIFIPKRWEKYKTFFQITILKYFVLWFSLVPTLATILTDLPSPLIINYYGSEIPIALALPFTWEVLWLASFFFVAALIIYYVQCPDFIKTYNSYTDYKSYQHDYRWLVWEAEKAWSFMDKDTKEKDIFVKRFVTKDFIDILDDSVELADREKPQIESEQTSFYFQHNGKKYAFKMPIIRENWKGRECEVEKGAFWEIFGRFSKSRFCSRVIVHYFLLCSLLLFLFVLVQNIIAGFAFLQLN